MATVCRGPLLPTNLFLALVSGVGLSLPQGSEDMPSISHPQLLSEDTAADIFRFLASYRQSLITATLTIRDNAGPSQED